MKKNILLMVLFPAVAFGQVGINTPSPTNKLDVNGDLRIRQIDIASSTPPYVLASDANGVIIKTPTTSLNGNIVVKRIYPSSSGGIQANTVTIDNLTFRFSNGSNPSPQMALINAPSSTKTFYLGVNQQFQKDGFQYDNNSLDYSTTNYSTFQTLVPASSGPGMSVAEYNLMHITDLENNRYYRVTFFVSGTNSNALYTMIAERF